MFEIADLPQILAERMEPLMERSESYDTNNGAKVSFLNKQQKQAD
jgi:hypothetical protein